MPAAATMKALRLSMERVPTPLGALLLVSDDQARVRAVSFTDREDDMQRLLRLHYADTVELTPRAAPSTARRELEAYFAGDLAALDRIAVAFGGTEFQREVWSALRRIPVGKTLSYGALAAQIGRPKAVRAVGAANGANPIAVVVPCHRVIGADASLTGYGGGLERKRWLLRHEGVRLACLEENVELFARSAG
jgi:methylated-DNA-[protein]-cysteine S-methyltransferase